jgi:hypothetical protein
MFLVLLASKVRTWKQALVIVQPEALLRWHLQGFKRSARGRVLASSVVEVRAMLLSPYCAEFAGLKLQCLRFLPAFSACCCSLFLSESGEPLTAAILAF